MLTVTCRYVNRSVSKLQFQTTIELSVVDDRLWLRLLKKSVLGNREKLPDLNLQGRGRARGCLNGSARRQERILGAFAGPFVSMMRNTAQ